MPKQYLIFSGGGINGVSFVGTIGFLRANHRFKGFAGTSIGALMALMCAVDLPVSAMLSMFLSIADMWGVGDVRLRSMAIVDHTALWYASTQPLLEMFGITDMTFGELLARTGKELKVCAHNLNRNVTRLFSPIETPNLSVVAAVVASMSVPLIFPPMEIAGEIYIDGGICVNLPLFAFPVEETILVRLKRPPSAAVTTAVLQTSMLTYVSQIACAVWHSGDNLLDKVLPDRHDVLNIPVFMDVFPLVLNKADLMSTILIGALVAYNAYPSTESMLLIFCQLKKISLQEDKTKCTTPSPKPTSLTQCCSSPLTST